VKRTEEKRAQLAEKRAKRTEELAKKKAMKAAAVVVAKNIAAAMMEKEAQAQARQEAEEQASTEVEEREGEKDVEREEEEEEQEQEQEEQEQEEQEEQEEEQEEQEEDRQQSMQQRTADSGLKREVVGKVDEKFCPFSPSECVVVCGEGSFSPEFGLGYERSQGSTQMQLRPMHEYTHEARVEGYDPLDSRVEAVHTAKPTSSRGMLGNARPVVEKDEWSLRLLDALLLTEMKETAQHQRQIEAKKLDAMLLAEMQESAQKQRSIRSSQEGRQSQQRSQQQQQQNVQQKQQQQQQNVQQKQQQQQQQQQQQRADDATQYIPISDCARINARVTAVVKVRTKKQFGAHEVVENGTARYLRRGRRTFGSACYTHSLRPSTNVYKVEGVELDTGNSTGAQPMLGGEVEELSTTGYYYMNCCNYSYPDAVEAKVVARNNQERARKPSTTASISGRHISASPPAAAGDTRWRPRRKQDEEGLAIPRVRVVSVCIRRVRRVQRGPHWTALPRVPPDLNRSASIAHHSASTAHF
jgi:hypothetical protein